MNINFAILLGLIFPMLGFAGDERGNGGDAVVCRDQVGKITKVELLDYYEARVMRNIQIDLGSDGTFSQKV